MITDDEERMMWMRMIGDYDDDDHGELIVFWHGFVATYVRAEQLADIERTNRTRFTKWANYLMQAKADKDSFRRALLKKIVVLWGGLTKSFATCEVATSFRIKWSCVCFNKTAFLAFFDKFFASMRLLFALLNKVRFAEFRVMSPPCSQLHVHEYPRWGTTSCQT